MIRMNRIAVIMVTSTIKLIKEMNTDDKMDIPIATIGTCPMNSPNKTSLIGDLQREPHHLFYRAQIEIDWPFPHIPPI